MRGVYAIVVAAMMSAGPALAAQDGKPDPGLERERARLVDALKHAKQQSDDAAGIEAALAPVLSDPAFAQLTGKERHSAYLMYGAALSQQDKHEPAKKPLALASAMSEAGAPDWYLRVDNSYSAGDYIDAARAAAKLARNWPDRLRSFSDRAIFKMGNEAQNGDAETAGELLSALFDAKWKPESPYKTADALWLGLIRIRLSQGDTAGAKDAAAAISDPDAIITMRSDKRFDALVAADPQRYDVPKAYDCKLADERAASAAAPDVLEGVIHIADTLYHMNRMQEALDLIDTALARGKADPKAFRDAADMLNWALDQRSHILFALGRNDEAFETLERGAAEKEHGMPNISQAINLADEYTVYDRPKDALRALTQFDPSDTSAYGRVALDDARVRAYFALGDKDNLAKTLAEMKTLQGDGTRPSLTGMLFVGDLDAAAALVVSQIEDPVTRADMLASLQDYQIVSHPAPGERTLHTNWVAMRARPDVAAAISKFGRIASYAVVASY